MLRLLGLAAGALVVSLAACGSDGETDDGSGSSGSSGASSGGSSSGGSSSSSGGLGGSFEPETTPTPVSDAPSRLSDLCPVVLPCECPSTEPISEAQCREIFSDPTAGAIAEGEAAGLTYDGSCLNRVISAFEFLGCATESEAAAHPDGLAAIVAALECRLFYGTDPLGASCTTLNESNGDSCDQEGMCDDGVCAPRLFQGREGDACDAFDQCEIGLACLDLTFTGAPSSCVVLPTAGQPCLQNVLCDARFFCDSTQTCRALPSAGQPCAPEMTNLVQDRCDAYSFCNAASSTCAELPVAGEPCSDDACAPGNTCNTGVCEAEDPTICGGGPFPLLDPGE